MLAGDYHEVMVSQNVIRRISLHIPVVRRRLCSNAIQRKLSLLTFEEFVDQKKPATDFSLKPVGISSAAESSAKGGIRT